MIYKIGQKVYFQDPDNNISSGIYEVIAGVTVDIVLLKTIIPKQKHIFMKLNLWTIYMFVETVIVQIFNKKVGII